MLYYTAVVRGTAFQAARAAADRGIPAAFVQELRASREVVLKIGPQFLPELASWLAEPQIITAGLGYPDGTLLIYSEHPHEGFERTAASRKL